MKENIKKYGGKGTGLIWLAENTDLGYTVPEFRIIDTSFYEECLKQELLAQLASQIYQVHNPNENVTARVDRIPKRLEEKCRELAREFKGRSVSVRSSAVVSEDSDRFSGAGIYDTFFLSEEDFNEKTLQEAVLEVYASVNSPRAVKYRQEAGLKDERMAVVVQEINHEFGAFHGVMQSRLQDVSRIIPVSFSRDIGAVVSGDPNSTINTVHLKKMYDGELASHIITYANDDLNSKIAYDIEKLILPLILKLKERYGKDFEAEFSAKLGYNSSGRVDLLQIRPLTNISDKKIRFPNKKPIFTTGHYGLCMGAGEYIGPWVTKDNVDKKGWKEPEHYALVMGALYKWYTRTAKWYDNREETQAMPDYDALTPRKKAMILTHNLMFGSHALTIAHEKGILCIGKHQDSFADHFTKPDKEVSPYIHIVSNGIEGRVYEATKQEAEDFARRMKK